MNRFFVAALLTSFVLSARAESKSPPRAITEAFLMELRGEAAGNHPSVRGAGQRIAATQAAIRSVRLWEDPMLGFGYMTGDEELVRDDGDLGFGIEVPLPRFGLVKARRSKAGAEVNLATANRDSVLLEIQRVVASSALEIALLDELIAIEQVELQWMEKMAQNALEKAKDPTANAADVLRLESEVARQRQKLETFGQERQRIADQLNILLGKPSSNPWNSLRLPPAIPKVPETAAIRVALSTNPQVRMAKAQAEIAERDLAIARAESGPVIALTADSSFYSGTGYRQTTVGAQISLPWFNESSYRANRERASLALSASRDEAEGFQRDAEFEAIAARTSAASSFRTTRRFTEDVIPRMEKAMESVESAWISSRATVLDVLDARRNLLASKVEERRSLTEGLAALETLRSLTPAAFSSK